MNLILAVVLFAIVGATEGYLLPIIKEVTPNSPAMHASLQVGDKITKVNKVNVDRWYQFLNKVYSN